VHCDELDISVKWLMLRSGAIKNDYNSHMKINVLGCSGGIGSGLRTTALRVNSNTLLDCGTGVGDVPLEELFKIKHVFITHSHLDHIADYPY